MSLCEMSCVREVVCDESSEKSCVRRGVGEERELCERLVAAGMAGCVSTVYLSRCQHISLHKQVT